MPPSSLPPPSAAAALARNDRYLLEFVEELSLCPYAKACREQGRLHREVIDLTTPLPGPVVERIHAIEARPAEEVDVALLLLPELQLEFRPFERFVTEVRAAYEKGRGRPIDFFIVAFHPDLPQDLLNADRAVTFIRRTPDPTIQLVRVQAIERARDGARDPKALSRYIAEAGLAAVQEAGPERMARLLASMRKATPGA